jgi:hypothetical protein
MAAAIYPYRVEVYEHGIAKMEGVEAIQRLGYHNVTGAGGAFLKTGQIAGVIKNVKNYYDYIAKLIKQHYYTKDSGWEGAATRKKSKYCVAALGSIVAFDLNTRSLLACNVGKKDYHFDHLKWESYSARWTTLYEPMLKEAPNDEMTFVYSLQILLFKCPVCTSRAGTDDFCAVNTCKANLARRTVSQSTSRVVSKADWLAQDKKRTEAGYDEYLAKSKGSTFLTMDHFMRNQHEVKMVRPMARTIV